MTQVTQHVTSFVALMAFADAWMPYAVRTPDGRLLLPPAAPVEVETLVPGSLGYVRIWLEP